MLPSIVLLFVFLAVPMDALEPYIPVEGEEVYIIGCVQCEKLRDPKRRAAHTIEIDVGHEEGDTFTTTGSFTLKEGKCITQFAPYEPAKGPLVIHFRHACPFGDAKKDTVLRVQPERESQPKGYRAKLGRVEL